MFLRNVFALRTDASARENPVDYSSDPPKTRCCSRCSEGMSMFGL